MQGRFGTSKRGLVEGPRGLGQHTCTTFGGVYIYIRMYVYLFIYVCTYIYIYIHTLQGCAVSFCCFPVLDFPSDNLGFGRGYHMDS